MLLSSAPVIHHKKRRVALMSLRSLVNLVVLVPLTVLVACQNPREKADGLAQAARNYLEAGNIAAADKAITEAIQLRDDSSDYYLLQGFINLQAQHVVQAYNAFDRALDLDRTNRQALAYVANIGVQVGRIKQAEEAADRLLILDGESLPAMQVKGMIALSRGRLEEANALAERILARNPGDEAGTILRARSLAINGQPDEAIKLIDQSIVANGKTPAMMTNKLNIYRRLGRAPEMLALYDEIVPLSGANLQYQLEQINLLYKTGDMDKARKSAVALLKEGSSNVQDYATLRRIWGQFDSHPIPAAAAAEVANSKDPQAIVNAVRYLILSGDADVAGRILDAVPPNYARFVTSLRARLLMIAGRKAEARAAVDKILKTDANDVDALILLGQLHFADGEINLALNDVQKAQAADPFNPEPYIVLAGVSERRGETWRALQILGEASRRLPQDYFILDRHLALLRAERAYGRAVSVATAFARAQPSAQKAWDILARQCAQASDKMCAAIVDQEGKGASTAYLLDDIPGTPVNRGLFGRL
jgi:tetratricopeptide (TPR) repeat protein